MREYREIGGTLKFSIPELSVKSFDHGASKLKTKQTSKQNKTKTGHLSILILIQHFVLNCSNVYNPRHDLKKSILCPII